MRTCPSEEVQVVASMADLAIAMDNTLLDLPLLLVEEKEEEGGAGEGAAVGEEVAEFGGGVEVQGRQWRWVRKGIVGGREKGNQESAGLGLGFCALYVYMCWWSIVVALGLYPTLLLWSVSGGTVETT